MSSEGTVKYCEKPMKNGTQHKSAAYRKVNFSLLIHLILFRLHAFGFQYHMRGGQLLRRRIEIDVVGQPSVGPGVCGPVPFVAVPRRRIHRDPPSVHIAF